MAAASHQRPPSTAQARDPAAVAGLLLAGYLLALVGLGWRRSRRRRALAAAARPAWATWWAPPAPWGGQVPLSTE